MIRLEVTLQNVCFLKHVFYPTKDITVNNNKKVIDPVAHPHNTERDQVLYSAFLLYINGQLLNVL